MVGVGWGGVRGLRSRVPPVDLLNEEGAPRREGGGQVRLITELTHLGISLTAAAHLHPQ